MTLKTLIFFPTLCAFLLFLVGCETEVKLGQDSIPASLNTTPVDTNQPSSASGVANGFAAGNEHVCVITDSNGVKCWGNGFNGELGNGKTGTTLTRTPQAVSVVGLESGVKNIVAGGDHTCILTFQGGVKCWGVNSDGQLGNGTFTNSASPIDVLGLTSGVEAFSAYSNNTCALTTSGTVKCWGSNNFGQIGDGSTSKRNVPTSVINLPGGIQSVSVGGLSACALTANNGVKCWGNSDTIGNAQTVGFSTIPLNVVGLSSGVIKLAGGDLAFYAVMNDGGVLGWGADGNGQMGDGAILGPKQRIPISIPGLGPGSGVVSFSTMGAGTHACAIRAGTVPKCWGKNDFSQASANVSTSLAQPTTDISSLSSDVVLVGTGSSFTCVLLSNKIIKCWGKNANGQLGDGTLVNRVQPVAAIF